jgi:hypothetical protein
VTLPQLISRATPARRLGIVPQPIGYTYRMGDVDSAIRDRLGLSRLRAREWGIVRGRLPRCACESESTPLSPNAGLVFSAEVSGIHHGTLSVGADAVARQPAFCARPNSCRSQGGPTKLSPCHSATSALLCVTFM